MLFVWLMHLRHSNPSISRLKLNLFYYILIEKQCFSIQYYHKYEDCYLHFRLNDETTSIYSWNWFHCFSKYFPWRWMHLCVWINFQSIFYTAKQAFWMHQPLLRVSKIVVQVIYFYCTGIKKSLGVKPGLYGEEPISLMLWHLGNFFAWAFSLSVCLCTL